MATINNVLNGLKVFAKYGGEEHLVCAEHDILYAGPPNSSKLTSEDEKALTDAGWHFDKSVKTWGIFT
jgi:hypothetical protein